MPYPCLEPARPRPLLLATTTAALLLAGPRASAAPPQDWAEQLGTAGYEYATGCAPDGNGGVFVSGTTSAGLGGTPMGYEDGWLARYDVSGTRLWLREIGTNKVDFLESSAPDGAGGLFLGGWTNGDWGATHAGNYDAWYGRFDAAGNELWVVQLGTNTSETTSALASDGAGGVFAVGSSYGDIAQANAGDRDIWLARSDGAGNEVWKRQFGSSAAELALGAAPDGAGGVVLCGSTDGTLAVANAGASDAWVARYDPAGSQLWLRQIGTSVQDVANAVVADGLGGCFVAGSTFGDLGGPNLGGGDVWLAHLDAQGQVGWVRQFGAEGYELARLAAADGAGGVFLMGRVAGSWGGAAFGGNDAWVGRFDGAGDTLWLQRFGSAAGDEAWAACADGAGSVFVGGVTSGALAGPHAGSQDAWIARFDGACGSSTSYCTASSTSIPGCAAAIASSGAPDPTDPLGFTITSGAIPGGNLGLAIFGANGAASTPFGTLGGKICVAGPIFRSAPKASGGSSGQCEGLYTFTLQDLANASPLVTPGAALNAQVWARDPANVDGFLLSDALAFTVCP